MQLRWLLDDQVHHLPRRIRAEVPSTDGPVRIRDVLRLAVPRHDLENVEDLGGGGQRLS